jgi:hypothetical protein
MELRQVGTLLLLIPVLLTAAQGNEDSLVDQFLVGDTELLEDDLASGSAFLKKAMGTAAAAAKKASMAAVAKKASASIKKVSASVKKADAISESNGKVTQPSNLAYGSNHKLNLDDDARARSESNGKVQSCADAEDYCYDAEDIVFAKLVREICPTTCDNLDKCKENGKKKWDCSHLVQPDLDCNSLGDYCDCCKARKYDKRKGIYIRSQCVTNCFGHDCPTLKVKKTAPSWFGQGDVELNDAVAGKQAVGIGWAPDTPTPSHSPANGPADGNVCII